MSPPSGPSSTFLALSEAVQEVIERRHVRFGSKADMCGAREHVRFTPNSDHKSRHAALVMSALHLKADMCGANRHVCFGPKADMRLQHLKDI
jgi:hypothetical protein